MLMELNKLFMMRNFELNLEFTEFYLMDGNAKPNLMLRLVMETVKIESHPLRKYHALMYSTT